MLGTFFVVAVVVVVVLGGLPEQIHHKKHFALPKIPAFQSNTSADLHSSPVATQKHISWSVHKIKALRQLDLSQCSTPTPPTESVAIFGLQIYKDDVQTVQPKATITDNIVLFLFK